MGEITINIMDLLVGILVIAAIVAVIMLIRVLLKVSKSLETLPATMEHLEKIMSSAENITSVVNEGTEGVKSIIVRTKKTVDDVADAVGARKNIIKASVKGVRLAGKIGKKLGKEK